MLNSWQFTDHYELHMRDKSEERVDTNYMHIEIESIIPCWDLNARPSAC